MKRLSKAILLIAAGLLGTGVAGLLGLKFYLESDSTQARIQDQLGKALKVPLTIGRSRVSLWGGLSLENIRVPGAGGAFLEAPSCSAHYRLLPLFQKRLEIYGLKADNAKISWRQDAEGHWTLPKREPAGPAAARPAEGAEAASDNKFEVHVDGIQLGGVSLELLDKAGQPVAGFQQIRIDCQILGPERAEGTVEIGATRWQAMLLERARSPFTYQDGILEVPGLVADLYGGQLTGQLTVTQPKEDKRPFTASLQLAGVDLQRLTTETKWAPDKFAGRLAARAELKGAFSRLAKVEGPGQLTVEGCQINQLDLFRTIGDVFNVEELSDLRLKDARADFVLGDERAQVQSLLLDGAGLQITASGPVRFDGKLALDSRLAFSETTARKLPDFVRNNFTNSDTNGLKGVDFKLSGTFEKPKTDLLDRVIGGKLTEQFDDLLSGLFGTRKKDDQKKKDEKKKDDKKKDDKKKKPAPDPAQGAQPAVAGPAGAPAAGNAATAPEPPAPAAPVPSPEP